MAIVPRPPTPGLINFDHTYGHPDTDRDHGIDRDLDTFVKPVHMPKPTPTELPDVLSIAPIDDTEANRSDILAAHGGIVDEAIPVLLALRSRVVERRIKAKQTKLEELARRQEVAKHVGEGVIRGESYSKSNDPLRPHDRATKRMARQLDRVHLKRRNEHGHAHSLSAPMHGGTSITLLDEKARSSITEEAHRIRNQHNYNKTTSEAEHLDHKFAGIVKGPTQKADQVRDVRDDLVVRAKALEDAKVKQQDKKDDKRALKELGKSIYGSSWTDGTYGYQITSKNRDGSITITAYDATGPIADTTVRPRHLKGFANSFGANF